jgi:uncharacterized membrane protein
LLGVLYAALGAFTFALNNVAMRRGVVTGSVLQGMALTVPIGGLSFLVMTMAFGELHQLVVFPVAALTWLACQGVVHFVIGRYCNYKSNQLMGVNLTAPVVQLQVPFAMMLAVVMLHEKFTVLQAIGSALMLGGSFITQGNAGKGKRKASAPLTAATPIPTVPSQEELAAAAELAVEICAQYLEATKPEPQSSAVPATGASELLPTSQSPLTKTAAVLANAKDVKVDESAPVKASPEKPYFAHLAMCKEGQPAPVQPPLGWVLSKETRAAFGELLKQCGNDHELSQLEIALGRAGAD